MLGGITSVGILREKLIDYSPVSLAQVTRSVAGNASHPLILQEFALLGAHLLPRVVFP